jgi:hypothetical protein
MHRCDREDNVIVDDDRIVVTRPYKLLKGARVYQCCRLPIDVINHGADR